MTDTRTVTEDHGRQPRTAPDALGVVILFARGEPGRTGEVAFVGRAPDQVLGRGPERPDDPGTRLAWIRQRPGRIEARPALQAAGLSRVQLVFTPEEGGVRVENRGRSSLFVDGSERDEAVVGVGGVLRIGALLALLVVRRPRMLPELPGVFRFGEPDDYGLVGESPPLWALRRELAWVAPRVGHVLLLGASGTGKELSARGIHHASTRRGGPFVARNASTLPDSLADAELFGHAAGYPQGGMPQRLGLVGEAEGGSLFLDEVGDLAEVLQPKLLRLLDAGEYQRLGDPRPRSANVRCIAATNRGLEALRADLAARFPFHLRLPDLAARREDIPLLARHQLAGIAADDPAALEGIGGRPALSASFVEWLVTQPLPANVRDVQQAVWRALMRGGGELLPPSAATVEAEAEALHPDNIQRVLDEHNGVQEHAWRALGLPSRHALARLIRRHGLVVRRKPGA